MSGSKNNAPSDGRKTVVRNKKAFFEYQVDDRVEAGLVLVGTEVKSIRNGKVQLVDAYARIEGGEAFLHSMHVAEYDQGTHGNHLPRRVRKLLLKKGEIARLSRKVDEKGYTLIPLELYFKDGRAKIELGLCKGKRQYDKRATIRDRDQTRDQDRERSGR